MTATALRTTLEPCSKTDTQRLVPSTQQTLGADPVYRLLAEFSIAGTVDPVTNEITLLIVMADQTQPMTLAAPRPALPTPEDSQRVVSDAELTCRELEVLQHLATGATYLEIAKALVLSIHMVERHLDSIYSKLAVHSRHEATRWAQTHHLI